MIDENTILWALGGLFVCMYLFTGYTVWRRWCLFDRTSSLLLAPLASTILIILVGTPLYWLYTFDGIGVGLLIILFSIIPIIAIARLWAMKRTVYAALHTLVPRRYSFLNQKKSFLVFCSLYLICATVCLFLLIQGRTIDASLGPWENIQPIFFIIYAITSFLLLLISYCQKSNTPVSLIFLVIHSLLTLSVLGIILPLGFGFDPHLHRAAETIISQYGVVLPKTLYYIGQYVTVVFTSTVFSIPLFYVDIWLVPLLASLSIIPLVVIVIQQWIGEKPMVAFLASLVFIIPFSSLINTTPWSLAFLLFVVSFLLVLIYIKQRLKVLLILAWLAAIASVFVHPLGGIPALVVVGLTTYFYTILPYISNTIFKSIVTSAVILICSVITPFAFLLNGLVSTQLKVSISPPTDMFLFLREIGTMLFSYRTRFNMWQDIAYTIAHVWGLLLIIIAIGVTIYCWQRYTVYRMALITLWSSWLVIVINFILIKGFIEFTSIVSYERAIFAQRLYDASTIVLVPLGAIALYYVIRRLHTASKAYPVLVLVSLMAFAGLITANLYVSYPKRDAYNAYHGYMVSAVNIATVQWIEQDASGADHIVLASQVLAAAAIQEFGFKKYYRSEVDGAMQDIFYYPVPTSSPLHEDYREMLTSPSREKVDTIMDTYNIETFYVVVNHYEPQYQGTKNKLRPFAQREQVIRINKSEDTVFVFEK